MSVRNARPRLSWGAIQWETHERKVERMQQRIYQEARGQQWGKVRDLQHLLARSLSTRLLAVKRVTEENAGRHTPGIDGRLWSRPADKVSLVETLSLRDYKPSPVRTTFIPKRDGTRRKLGIPTIRDRAMQCIVKMALEPEWEARFEPHSFGFRPRRSCLDAASNIYSSLVSRKNGTREEWWVLDADIKACFDNIDHAKLLAKLGNFRGIVARWLKAGAISTVAFETTTRGTPQGGVVSPLLANIALDGIERLFGIYSKTGRYLPPSQRRGDNYKVSLFRYADDFVVIAPSREVLVNHVIPEVARFLRDVGLEFNQAKTRVVKLRDGFEFLGFRFQEFPRGKRPPFLFCGPSRTRTDDFLLKTKEMVKRASAEDPARMLKRLNARLVGWSNYYRHCMASKIFAYVDWRVFRILWDWARRRHYRRGKKWIKERYWKREGNRNWVFRAGTTRLVDVAKRLGDWMAYLAGSPFKNPFSREDQAYWMAKSYQKRRSTADRCGRGDAEAPGG